RIQSGIGLFFDREARQTPAQGRGDGVIMRNFLTTLVAALLPATACAQAPADPPAQPAPGAPKLLVVISVDQFSANLWDEYRPNFTQGFARLAQGAVFHNGYQ